MREKEPKGDDADKIERPQSQVKECTLRTFPEEQDLSGGREEEEEEVNFEEDEDYYTESSESECSKTHLSPRSETPLSPLALELVHSASVDGTIPFDPLMFDVDEHKESDQHSLIEWPLKGPSPLFGSARPFSSDARLEHFQTTSRFGSQQPVPVIPEQDATLSHGRQSPYLHDDYPPPATCSDAASVSTEPNQSGWTQASIPTNHQSAAEGPVHCVESMTWTADSYHGSRPQVDDDVSQFVLTLLGLGEDQPRFTDQDEEEGWTAISDEERASVLADLFGKKCLVDTHQKKRARKEFDESTVSFLVKQMRKEIERVPLEKKEALIVAQEKCREEEFCDSRLEVFLRSEGMNAKVSNESLCVSDSPRAHKDMTHDVLCLCSRLSAGCAALCTLLAVSTGIVWSR